MSWRRQYLENMFPNYDYRNPSQSWIVDYRVENFRKNVALQINAFHHFYAQQQCEEEGKVGLAFDIPLPFCLNISNNKDNPDRDIFANPESIHIFLERERFPLIVASAVISSLPCHKSPEVAKCDGADVAKVMRNWATLLSPNGLLVAAIIDSKIAHLNGVDILKTIPFLTHKWGPQQFEKMVETYLFDVYDIEELDTLKNYYAFSVVLRKIC